MTFTNIVWAIYRNDCAYSSKQPSIDTFTRYLSAISSESQISFPLTKEENRSTVQLEEVKDLCCYTDGSWASGWKGGAGLVLVKGEELKGYQYWGVSVCCLIQAEAIAMFKAVEFVRKSEQSHCTFLTDCSVIAKVATQLQPPQDEDWRAAKELHEIWRAFK